MEVRWIWLAVGSAAVAVTAVLALKRPQRQSVIVGSLKLWRRAIEAVGDSGQNKARRLSLAWLLLLVGSAAAVCGLAMPAHHQSALCRRVCVGLYPTAEVSSAQAMGHMTSSALALLERFAEADKVQLLLPPELGGRSEWLSVAQARSQISNLTPLAVRHSQVKILEPDPQAQHSYYFVPAGAAVEQGPATSVTQISTQLGKVVVDAIGAEILDDSQVEVLVAFRNVSDKLWRGAIRIKGCDASGIEQWRSEGEFPDIAPGQRRDFIFRVKPSDLLIAMAMRPGGSDEQSDAQAYLVKRSVAPRKVAIVGTAEPLLMRYVRSDDMLTLVDDANHADIVIANRTTPPLSKPALTIDPPSGPDGWLRSEEASDVSLRTADVSADHPVTKHVDLAGVAVRRMKPWRAGGAFTGSEFRAKAVVSHEGKAVVLVGPENTNLPKRVYLAFDVFQGNTGFAMQPVFIIMLRNAMKYLSPPGPAQTFYEYSTPRTAVADESWKNLLTPSDGDQHRGPLPWPGVYGDSSGKAHAVNLVGLRDVSAEVDPATAAANAPMPAPGYIDVGRDVWPAWLGLAVVLWLAGWAAKLR